MVTERPEIPSVAGEREMLRAFLDFHRATLAMKCDGLSDDELRRAAVPSSTLSLLGLVRHMAEVERAWFRRIIGGEPDLPLVWSPDGDFQVAYDASGRDPGRGVRRLGGRGGARPADRARGRVARRHGVGAARWGEEVSLRLVMLHMIHEYARHNGHADLLREGVDGTVGV